jgi:beta-N-acetylhexosaminidase
MKRLFFMRGLLPAPGPGPVSIMGFSRAGGRLSGIAFDLAFSAELSSAEEQPMNRPPTRPLTVVFIILAVVLLATLAFVVVAMLDRTPSGGQPPSGERAGTAAPAWASHDEAAAWADRTLAGLTLERKVGQMICPDIAAGYIAADDPRLAQWKRNARDLGVGMMVLYGGTPRDVAHLLNTLQREADLPLLMAADFEGGPGQQVSGASEFPANMAFAAAGSEDLMYRAARAGADEGRAMGIHLTYTPVVDVSMRPDNPAESVRSFGGDLALLGRMVRAYVKGTNDGGMLNAAKHFPGRGDVALMPGRPDFNTNDKPAASVEAEEFLAFRHAVEAGVTFIMTEHIAVPSVTGGSDLPASVEPKLATGWIRDKLGFQGLVTTDDLWYPHVTARFGENEVAVLAVEAGHDIVLKPKDPAGAVRALVEAVRSGRIAEERIDRSVRKLLYWKARLNLHKDRFVDEEDLSRHIGTAAHLALVREVADKSLTLLKNEGVLPVNVERLAGAKMVNIAVQKVDGDPSPGALAGKLAAAFPGIRTFALRPDMDPGYIEKVREAAKDADLVILSLFLQRNRLGDAAPVREPDLAFIKQIIKAKPGAVVAMSYGNPHLLRKLGDVPAFVVGYGERGWFGNQAVYFEAFIGLLRGEVRPAGKLPVKVSDAYPIGAGLTY